MKKVIFSWLFSMVFVLAANAQYADRTGYEGDNFSLEGAIELFKQSYSIRDFERKLNTQDTWVNNLDLDWDGRIDYIRVEHRRQSNYHAIILSVPLGYYDVQDIAVIEIERVSRRRAVLQIVGDPDIYGEEVIVEPIFNDGFSYNGDYRYDRGVGGIENVYYWPAVQHMLGRNYRVYASPYYYHYYPTWWTPWRPCAWDVFRPRIVVYHRHYHVVHVHRVVHVHTFYKPYRVYSHNVLVKTNKVRVKHGKAVVHRKPMKQHKNHKRYNEYVKATKSVANQPRGAGHTKNIENNRKAQERVPATTPRTSKANKTERSQATPPSTGRVNTDARKPPVDNKRTAPATSDKAKRNTQAPKRSTPKATPRTDRSSSATKSTPRSTPKATPKTNRSSSAKKSTSRSTPKANRSTSQPQRSTSKASSRSTTTKRSTPSASKSKSSSRSSASSSKSSSRPAAKSSGSKRSSSSSTKATRKTSSSSSRNKRG